VQVPLWWRSSRALDPAERAAKLLAPDYGSGSPCPGLGRYRNAGWHAALNYRTKRPVGRAISW